MQTAGITQKELADMIGKQQTAVSFIINGVRDINADRAIRLGLIFKTWPEFWQKLQAWYDRKIMHQKHRQDYQKVEQHIEEFAFA